MNSKFLIILLLTFAYSCSDTKDINKFLFIVPVEMHLTKKLTDPNEPPPPPLVKPYYTNCNFIVDSSGQLFFFQTQTYRWICGTGLNENTQPEYIDLRPNEIVAVPKEGLKSFVELNVLSQDPVERVVAIGLLKDTIKSETLYTLTQILKDTLNKTRWFIRNATPEEGVALGYKKRQVKFYPEDIHWDSTKTRFPPKVDITDFTPPKFEE